MPRAAPAACRAPAGAMQQARHSRRVRSPTTHARLAAPAGLQVKTAKNHTPGFVVHPICMLPSSTVAELYSLRERKGFTSVCVTGAGQRMGARCGCVGAGEGCAAAVYAGASPPPVPCLLRLPEQSCDCRLECCRRRDASPAPTLADARLALLPALAVQTPASAAARRAWRHALINFARLPPSPYHLAAFPADTGKVGGKLLGMVTTRDWDFVADLHTPLSEIMTTDLETAQYGATAGWLACVLLGCRQLRGLLLCAERRPGPRAARTRAQRQPASATHALFCLPRPLADTVTAEKAMALLQASKRGKLPIVNSAGELLALATRALFKEDARMPMGGAWRSAEPPAASASLACGIRLAAVAGGPCCWLSG